MLLQLFSRDSQTPNKRPWQRDGQHNSWWQKLVLHCTSVLTWQRHDDNNNDNVCLFVGWLTSQQHVSVSQGRICSDNFTCCHTETEVADQTFHLTQSQYTDTGPTSPSTQVPGRVATGLPIFKSLVWFDPRKIPPQVGFEPQIFCSRGGCPNHLANEAVL